MLNLNKPTLVSVSAQMLLGVALALPVAALGQSDSGSAGGSVVAARGLPDFTDLVDLVGPSVVNIRTTQRLSHPDVGDGLMDEDMQEFFRRFFGVPLPNRPRRTPQPGARPLPEQEVPRGVGSGFIISPDGFVMTNAHVLDGADEVIVTLADKREFKARIVGADKRTDVAVLKIEAAGLSAVRVGDVNRLRVGEWVMAIGSPFELQNTVTAGIVSAKQRDTGEYLPFIQTDVAVNPGNSGGPLINMRGEVVGINSHIYSRSGGFMGISFAIPIDEAMRVSAQLRVSGHVTRGRIGVQIAEISREVAESIGLGKPQGALVRGVDPGSPADKAGVEAGDIITRFDGHVIDKASDLPRLVGNTKPGTRSAITVFRRSQSRELSITVAEMEADQTASGKPNTDGDRQPQKAATAIQALGLTVSNLTESQKKELKIKHGVRVEAAADASARAGLRAGDVILSVDNTEIANVRELEAAAAKADRSKSANMLVLVQRDKLVQYMLIRLVR
ncbi:MAG: Do family serine endopeptidase [Burkholderiaceae bacterium]|nr:Do family serine endopeptidase [Burkholderiaceae bacterium]